MLKKLGEKANAHPVHRRDPHHHRRRCHDGRHAGRVQPAQARARQRPAALHRSTTYHRVPPYFEKDRALGARFQKIDVVEPTGRGDVGDPRGQAQVREHHHVKYAGRADHRGGRARGAYINDRHLPDKAIDVIDEGRRGAEASRRSRKRKKTIGKTEIEEIVAKIARIPPERVERRPQ